MFKFDKWVLPLKKSNNFCVHKFFNKMNYVLAGIELALLEWSKAYIRQKDWRRADLLSTREGKWQPQVWENLMPLEHSVLMYLLCSIVICRVDKNISQYRLNLLHCEVCTTLCNNFQLMRMSQKAEISRTVFFFSVTAFLHQLYVLMFNFKPTLDLTYLEKAMKSNAWNNTPC